MKILRILLYLLLGIVGLYLILSLLGPKKLELESSIEIEAPQKVVFEYVNSLQDMEKWSPWADLENQYEVEYGGEEGVVGSYYTWSGDTTGTGKQTITAIEPYDSVGILLEFQEPRASQADVWITLDSLGPKKTEVHWGFKSDVSFLERGILLFMNVEDTLKGSYDKGLKMLKSLVSERKLSVAQGGYEVQEITLPAQNYMVKRDTVKFEEFSARFTEAGEAIHNAIENKELNSTGPLVAMFYTWDTIQRKSFMAIGVPTDNEKAVEGFELIEMEEQKAWKIDYYGAYAQSGLAHDYMAYYAENKGVELTGPAIERYITDPTEVPDTSQWLTEVIYPIHSSKDQ